MGEVARPVSDRTFQWWRFKLGFQGDPEFVRLAVLAPSPEKYLAALGLLLTVYDTAHKRDSRTPRGTILDPGGDLLALLEAAGILEPDGSIPEATWSKYRVQDRPRDEKGHYLPINQVAPRGHHRGTNTETETERRTSAKAQRENGARTERTARPTKIGDELAKAPWNNRSSKR